jgi:hypothetical protein
MKLYDLNDFLRLSATLHLQLSAQGVGLDNILQIVTNRRPLARCGEHEILQHVLAYLQHAYGQRRRLVGPPAILHPLRATALLTHASGQPHLLDMLTELLHDKFEDLTPEALGQDRFLQMETEFRGLLREIDPTDEWYLMERLDDLTQRKTESYYQYIGRLLDRARRTHELVRSKLADRLDNTLDLHIDVEDPLEGENFFQVVFRILFPPSGQGYQPGREHPLSSPLNGAQRLYQLFKNAILLSLIREKHATPEDPAGRRLFEALALASMHEAQRIALHIMGYHLTEVDRQRVLLMAVQRYAQEGGMKRTTRPSGEHPLDGLFMLRFDHADSRIRDRHLEDLYRDKGLMLQAAISFVVIFLNFVHSPDYWVRGISDHGIETEGGNMPA